MGIAFYAITLKCPKCNNSVFKGKYFYGPIPHEKCIVCGLKINKEYQKCPVKLTKGQGHLTYIYCASNKTKGGDLEQKEYNIQSAYASAHSKELPTDHKPL